MNKLLSLIIGWLLDLVVGDPQRLPHPIVWFGKMIAFFEHRLNKGTHRMVKGAATAIVLILLVYGITAVCQELCHRTHIVVVTIFDAILIFYCLAGTTLIREVREVFLAVDRSLDDGRRQVARIVGRDTSELNAQEIRTAALETLAENLSDGVIAPLFWLAIGGVPAMMAYKMVNTLDSMIGYRTERYRLFGCVAARIDDVANYIPARLTALLMVIGSVPPGALRRTFSFIARNGRRHASPNSGYPESALAAILDCRFGGPHHYFGELIYKPYIGDNDRLLTSADMRKAIRVNRCAETIAVVLLSCIYLLYT